jgi:dTDP-4-amino-4,6-dideoxygalactose transaminase
MTTTEPSTPIRTAPLPSVGDPSGRRLGAEEIAAVTRVITSGQLNSTVGGETRAWEQEFGAYCGVDDVVACTSGTAALHLAVAAVDPAPGDEIITTGLSDAGTVLPIVMQNAVPVFADVDPYTGILDPASVEASITSRTRAIIVVHLFGVPAPVEELREIADRHDVILIEDCAQAYATRTASGALAGTIGDLGCFSLQQSKHITAGDGGMVISKNRPDLARRARLFADKAWPRDTNERTHLFLSLNYRMTELQAAVARAQLPKLDGIVGDRRDRARQLTEAIADLPGLRPAPSEGTSYWQFPLFIDPETAGGDGHPYAEILGAEGIPSSPGYIQRPLYLTPALAEAKTYGDSGFPLTEARHRYAPGLCPTTEALIGGRLLVIGWNENYTESDVDDIAAALRKASRQLAG